MKKGDDIDDIFRKGLQEKAFHNKDAVWRRIDLGLNKQHSRRRRLVLLMLLFIGLSTAGFFLFLDKGKVPIATKQQTIFNHAEPFSSAVDKSATAQNISINKKYPAQQLQTKHISKFFFSKKITTINTFEKVETTQPKKDEDEAAAEQIKLQHLFVDPEKIKIIGVPVLQAINNYTASLKKPAVIQKKKISIEILAGAVITNIKNPAGYYAGAAVCKPLKKGASIAAAVLYSVNKVQEGYRLSNKPSSDRQTDATLDNLSMLQLRLQFRQQVKNSRFFVTAGLTPVYILSAAIDNVPHTDSVYPGFYRRFTLQDINRLNVLFTAGARYQLLSRLSAEINGSYGLTELVKNSYINQSNVKSNFKKLQIGLVYKLK